jgi:hypothetical protein
MNQLYAGVYKHYKGGLYLILGAARHSETEERLVAYVPLYVRVGPRIVVRPYDTFFETVTVKDVKKPRFMYIGESIDEVFNQFYDPLSGYKGADRVDD